MATSRLASRLLPGLGLLAACGAPAAPPAVVSVSAASAVVAAPPEPPRPPSKPVEPKGLFLSARWRNPKQGLEELFKAFDVPVPLDLLLGSKVAQAYELGDVEGTAELFVTLDPASTDEDPKFRVAVSLPVQNFDDLASKAGDMKPVAPGILRRDDCELVLLPSTGLAGATGTANSAPGDRPARFLCVSPIQAMDEFRPWLLGGDRHFGHPENDATMTVHLKPLRDRYLGLLRTGSDKLNKTASDALAELSISDPDLLSAPRVGMDELLRFVEDLDSVDIYGQFETSRHDLRSTLSVHFSGNSGWATHLLTDANAKAGPPPAFFWRLPKESQVGLWGYGNDPRMFEGVRRVIVKSVGEGLRRLPLPSGDAAAITNFVEGVPRMGGVWVSSSGHTATTASSKGRPKDFGALLGQSLGWGIGAQEIPFAEYVAWIKQVDDLSARTLRYAHSLQPVSPDVLKFLPKVAFRGSLPGWPKGTVALDYILPVELLAYLANNKPVAEALLQGMPASAGASVGLVPKSPLTLRFAVVPDGKLTWFGFSADVPELKKRLAAVLPGAPPTGTLATREGLEELHSGAARTWAGFLTMSDAIEKAVRQLEGQKPKEAKMARAVLAALPDGARTPILLLGSGAPGDRPSFDAELVIQKGTLADTAAAMKFLIKDPKGHDILNSMLKTAP